MIIGVKVGIKAKKRIGQDAVLADSLDIWSMDLVPETAFLHRDIIILGNVEVTKVGVTLCGGFAVVFHTLAFLHEVILYVHRHDFCDWQDIYFFHCTVINAI